MITERTENKLKSNRGESIAEVLITALVVALGALLLVGMVVAARNIIQKSERAYNTHLNKRNALEALDSADHSSDNTPADDGTTYTVNQNPDGRSLYLSIKPVDSAEGKKSTIDTSLFSELKMYKYEKDTSSATQTLDFNVVEEGEGTDAKTKLITYEPHKENEDARTG